MVVRGRHGGGEGREEGGGIPLDEQSEHPGAHHEEDGDGGKGRHG